MDYTSKNNTMKNSCILLLIIHFMLSCKSSADHDAYDFGGMMKQIANYKTEIEALEKKADRCVDISAAYKYATMAKNLRKEADNEIKQLFESLPKPVLIPVEQAENTHVFSLSELEIISVDLSAFILQAKASCAKRDSTQPMEVYLCGLDESGTEILPTLCLTGMNGRLNNHELILSGQLDHPENFAGLLCFKVIDDKFITQ